MKKIPVAIYRGGTSRALFFHKKDLPESIEEQDKFILQAIGSGHPLQIDGLGGGHPLTSKCAIIGPSTKDGADIDYTFLYPSLNKMTIDRNGNCGNISSAVGPFAVNEGLIKPKDKKTSIIIHNTNTGTLLKSSFELKNGRYSSIGNCSIDGVPGTGSEIQLEYVTNSNQPLLPTSQPINNITVPGFLKPLEVTIVNPGTPAVICSMKDLEISDNPHDWEENKELWKKLESIRKSAASLLSNQHTEITPSIPKIIAVDSPTDFIDLQGRNQAASSHDLIVLTSAMGLMHKSFAVTGAIALAAAAFIPNTIPYNLKKTNDNRLTLGHPSGQLSLNVSFLKSTHSVNIKSISLIRTANEIMRGELIIDD